MRTNKPVFKRASLSLDISTIEKCKEIANEKSQSVSSLIRNIVGQIYSARTREDQTLGSDQ